jgi:DNA-binding SARP family transcriptional activator/cytochrome c-type biogenesis protein CcmH/NrfG
MAFVDRPERVILRLLGNFELISAKSSSVILLKNKKARCLLAYLAMQPHLSAQRVTVANLLWPDCTDENARHSLRQCLVNLRKELESVSPKLLKTNGESVCLDADLIEVDAANLLLATTTPDRGAHHELLASVKGDFLPDHQLNEGFSNWVSDVRRQIHHKLEQLLQAVDANPSDDEETARAVVVARLLTQSDPFYEEYRRLLISLTARLHGYARALAEYKSFVEFLRREGSGDPEPATSELIRNIEQRPPRSSLPPMQTQRPDKARDASVDESAARSAAEEIVTLQVQSKVETPHTESTRPADELAGPHGPLASLREFRFFEVSYRMVAAAAAFLALALVLHSVDRWAYVDQAKAKLSDLLAEAQGDPIAKTVPLAVRLFQGASGDRLTEEVREAIYDTVSKIPVVNLLADPESASPSYLLNGRVKAESGSQVLVVDLSRSDGSLLWREKFVLGKDANAPQDIARRIGREIELALVKSEAHAAIARNDMSTRSLLLSARALNVRGASGAPDPEALKLYEKALSLHDNSATALAGAAGQIIAHQILGLRTDAELQRRAEAYLRKAISIDPNQPLAHFYMGMLHKGRGQAAQAISSFNRALELNPSFAPAYANLGHAMMLLGRRDEALDNIRYAMRISPNDGFYAIWCLFAGEIEFERGNIDAAIDWFRQAIARGPHLSRAYAWIAGAHESAGNSLASAENIQKFRSLIGDEPSDKLVDRLQKAPEGGLQHARPKLYDAVSQAVKKYL